MSQLVVKAKTIIELKDQLQYQLKVVQGLVKTIGSPPAGGSFSSIPACIRTSSSIFQRCSCKGLSG